MPRQGKARIRVAWGIGGLRLRLPARRPSMSWRGTPTNGGGGFGTQTALIVAAGRVFSYRGPVRCGAEPDDI